MSVASSESQLDRAFGILLAKARQREEQQRIEQALSSALIINFDGVGQPLTVGMGGIPEMPPGAFTIVGAHMAAGIWSLTDLRIVPIAVTATVDIQLATQGSWGGGSRPLYGSARPGLSSQAETDIDVSSWITELQPGDMLAYALATFTGTASVLTLTLALRRVDVAGINAPSVTDETGAVFTDSSGLAFTTRS